MSELINIDEDLENSDWIKTLSWDLPTDPTEFLEVIGGPDQLDAFMKLPAARKMPAELKNSLPIPARYVEISSDFVQVAALAGISIPLSDIEVRFLRVPHRPPSTLPSERLAVYVFMLGDRCLKVGKAGPKSA